MSFNSCNSAVQTGQVVAQKKRNVGCEVSKSSSEVMVEPFERPKLNGGTCFPTSTPIFSPRTGRPCTSSEDRCQVALEVAGAGVVFESDGRLKAPQPTARTSNPAAKAAGVTRRIQLERRTSIIRSPPRVTGLDPAQGSCFLRAYFTRLRAETPVLPHRWPCPGCQWSRRPTPS
jgi:hypothetical protein